LDKPGDIWPWDRSGKYVYYCDGVDISQVESDYSDGICVAYCYPSLDVKMAMADVYNANESRFVDAPEMDCYGLANFTIFDYNGVRDKFKMRLTDSWTYAVTYKNAFDGALNRIWTILRQEQRTMACYKLSIRTHVNNLTDHVPFNRKFHVTPLSCIRLTPQLAKCSGPVYDVSCVGCYLMKCIVLDGWITITCFGPETVFIRDKISVPDMEVWFLAKSYPVGDSCAIEILSGFTSAKTVMPGYRNLCLESLMMIKMYPHFFFTNIMRRFLKMMNLDYL